MVRCHLPIDLDLQGIETKLLVLLERDEYGKLGAGRVQQTLLEPAEFRGDGQDVRLDLLHLPIEATHVVPGEILGTRRV